MILLPLLLASFAQLQESRAGERCEDPYARIAKIQGALRVKAGQTPESSTSELIQRAKDRLRQRLMTITGSHHPIEYARADTVYRELNSYLAPAELERRIRKKVDRTIREIELYPETKEGYLEATAALQVRGELLASSKGDVITELPTELRPMSVDFREIPEELASAHVRALDPLQWRERNYEEYSGWNAVYKRRLEILENLQSANKEKGIEASYPIHIPMPTSYARVNGELRPSRYRFFSIRDPKALNYTLEHFESVQKTLEARQQAFANASTARPDWDFGLTSSLYAPKGSYLIEAGDLAREIKSNQSLLDLAQGSRKKPSLVQKLDIEQARRLEVLKIIRPDLERSGLTAIATRVSDAFALPESYLPPPSALQALRRSELHSEWERLKSMLADTSSGEAVRRIQKLHKVIWKFKIMADYLTIGGAAFYLGRYLALKTDFLGYDEKMLALDLQTVSCITEISASEASECLQSLRSAGKIRVAGRSVPIVDYASRMNLIFRGHVEAIAEVAGRTLSAPGAMTPSSKRLQEIALAYLHKAETICSPKGLKLRSNDPGEHLESLMSCYAILASSNRQVADAELRAISLQNPDSAQALADQVDHRNKILRELGSKLKE